jgi:hypothetical protein
MQDVQPEPVIRPTAVVIPRPAVEEIVPATVTPPLVTEEIVLATVTPPLVTEETVPATVIPPLVTEEVVPARQDIVAGTEAQSEQSPSPMLEDPVLDADADGESDPDIDMDATNASHL